jgi:hypothetical protein
VIVAVAFAAQPARATANGLNVSTWTFRSGSDAKWVIIDGNSVLFLAKTAPTTEVTAAGAHLNGIKGLSFAAGFKIGFTVVGIGDYCSNGAPRFNVHLMNDPITYFLGCALGDRPVGNVVSFTAGFGYGQGPGCEVSCQLPSSGTIDSINIVFDEMGATHLDTIFVGEFVAESQGHT